jgi:hypothetical protein
MTVTTAAASLTAVLLTSSPEVTTTLLYGETIATRAHPSGRLAFLGPGELVLYFVRASLPRAFLFRTLVVGEPLSTAVPGVFAPVRLLAVTATLDRSSKLARMLRYVHTTGRVASALSDDFYLRIHALLDGRLPKHKVLDHLLSDEDASLTRT